MIFLLPPVLDIIMDYMDKIKLDQKNKKILLINAIDRTHFNRRWVIDTNKLFLKHVSYNLSFFLYMKQQEQTDEVEQHNKNRRELMSSLDFIFDPMRWGEFKYSKHLLLRTAYQ